MVFFHNPDGYAYAGHVVGFQDDGVLFRSRRGNTHYLSTYYSWLQVVCPD
jgi:hypothetical protein